MHTGKILIKNLNSNKFILILLVIIIIVVIIVFLSKKNNQENFKCVPNLSNFPERFKNDRKEHDQYQTNVCDKYTDNSICGNADHVCDDPNPNSLCNLGKRMCYWEPRKCKAKDPNKKYSMAFLGSIEANKICGDTKRIYCNPDRQCPAGWGGFSCNLSKNDCELQGTIKVTDDTIREAMISYFKSLKKQNSVSEEQPHSSVVEQLHYYFPIADWDTSEVTDMSKLFFGYHYKVGLDIEELIQNANPDISKWDVSNVTDMSMMFFNLNKFNQNIGEWDVSNVTNMRRMFSHANNFNQNIGGWNVSKVTNMSDMFNHATNFNQDINTKDALDNKGNKYIAWDVSNVTNMRRMFSYANNFNQNIGGWNVSNVTNMAYMFNKAPNFDQNIGEWDVSRVESMVKMFSDALSFNQDISQWDVLNVKYMNRMFLNAKSFNQNICNWAIPPDNNYDMFLGSPSEERLPCKRLKLNNETIREAVKIYAKYKLKGAALYGPIEEWDVSDVTDMSYLFNFDECESLYDHDISGWDVSNVRNMKYMFSNIQFLDPSGKYKTPMVGPFAERSDPQLHRRFSTLSESVFKWNEDGKLFSGSDAYPYNETLKMGAVFGNLCPGYDYTSGSINVNWDDKNFPDCRRCLAVEEETVFKDPIHKYDILDANDNECISPRITAEQGTTFTIKGGLCSPIDYECDNMSVAGWERIP